MRQHLWFVFLYVCVEMVSRKWEMRRMVFCLEHKKPLFTFDSRYKCLGKELWVVNKYDVPLRRVSFYTGSATLANILLYQQQLYWAKTHVSQPLVNVLEKKWRRKEVEFDNRRKSWVSRG
jgi:hypothetical protein